MDAQIELTRLEIPGPYMVVQQALLIRSLTFDMVLQRMICPFNAVQPDDM